MRDHKGIRRNVVRQVNERYYHRPLIRLMMLVHQLGIVQIYDEDDIFIQDSYDTYGYVDRWQFKKESQ